MVDTVLEDNPFLDILFCGYDAEVAFLEKGDDPLLIEEGAEDERGVLVRLTGGGKGHPLALQGTIHEFILNRLINEGLSRPAIGTHSLPGLHLPLHSRQPRVLLPLSALPGLSRSRLLDLHSIFHRCCQNR